MSDMTNAEIARFTAECFNTRDFRATIPYLSSDLEWTEVPNGRVFRGPEGCIEEYEGWARAFPDGRVEVQNVISEGDYVVVEMIVTGTNTGPVLGPDGTELPPTGKKTTVHLCDVMYFQEGKVVSGKSYFDLPR
tara:strand:+ start:225 stop:626 length:402 start_codon:yes stop_codon:yes gene_type:complete